MDIKGVTNNFFPISSGTQKSSKAKKESSVKSDKFEISNEARVLQTTGANNVKDLSAVQQKIADKYYDQPEVIAKTADAVLAEIAKQ
jgi:hypothetical protein